MGNSDTSTQFTSQLHSFGFKNVDFFGLLHKITSSFGGFVGTIFTWVYELSVLAALVGALVFIVGAMSHHNRWKANGAKIFMWAIAGFVIAVIAPGVILSLKSSLG